jgi:hypothetical protein
MPIDVARRRSGSSRRRETVVDNPQEPEGQTPQFSLVMEAAPLS